MLWVTTLFDSHQTRSLGVTPFTSFRACPKRSEGSLALTNIVQSFPGIFFGLLGAVIGRVLMIYFFVPLQVVLVRWWAHRTPQQRSRLPRPVPSAWRPVMVLSGLRGALSLALVLSLPTALEQRDLLTDIVYGVILVTLLGQGLTLRVLLPRWKEKLVRAEEPLPSQA